MKQENIDSIRLFNKYAGELFDAPFTRHILESTQKLEYSMDGGTITDVQITEPGKTYTREILLTIRMFKQDNDRISLRNIKEIYEKEDVNNKYRDRLHDAYNNHLSYLKQKCSVYDGENCYTKEQVFNYFVYGYYAHTNKSKQYQNMTRHEILAKTYYYEFYGILAHFLQTIGLISSINEEVLKSIKSD